MLRHSFLLPLGAACCLIAADATAQQPPDPKSGAPTDRKSVV